MFELQGKYASAKIFASTADEDSIRQVIELLNLPFTEGSQIRMMPDIQAGVGCTVGTTMTIKDKVCPNIVGVDIGCGMEVAILREQEIDLPKLDRIIHEHPCGDWKEDGAAPVYSEHQSWGVALQGKNPHAYRRGRPRYSRRRQPLH